jgi:hypothetical protein
MAATTVRVGGRAHPMSSIGCRAVRAGTSGRQLQTSGGGIRRFLRRRVRSSIVTVEAMATLADVARRLELDWQRRQRLDPPRPRWAAHHPSLDVDPNTLRHRIAGRDDAGRELLGRLVALAIAGDRAASTLVTLALLPRMVAVERRRHNPDRMSESYAGGYAPLAGTLWEAIVTTPNPQRRWLREDIERRAWRGLYRGHTRSPERNSLDVDSAPFKPCGDFSGDVVSRVSLDQTLDRLSRCGHLNSDRRRILELIAADTNPSYPRVLRKLPGVNAARRRRDRTLARMRTCTALIDALVS